MGTITEDRQDAAMLASPRGGMMLAIREMSAEAASAR
jgi:hypothetical protein